MSGDLTARDVIVQQLAEILAQAEAADNDYPWYGWERLYDEGQRHYLMLARAVLASGLVVPTSDVLRLAQQWDEYPGDSTTGPEYYYGLGHAAAELRALTQQEPQ